MRKSVLVLAVLAAGLSSAAVAKDLKQEKKAVVAGQVQGKAAVSGPARMSDADMDKVTGGSLCGDASGSGCGNGNDKGQGYFRNNNGNGRF